MALSLLREVSLAITAFTSVNCMGEQKHTFKRHKCGNCWLRTAEQRVWRWISLSRPVYTELIVCASVLNLVFDYWKGKNEIVPYRFLMCCYQ